jgi:hypothetical protein
MAAKRELIEPTPGDKRYVRRDDEGRFKEVEDVGEASPRTSSGRRRTTRNPGRDIEATVRSSGLLLPPLMSEPFFTVSHSNRTVRRFH